MAVDCGKRERERERKIERGFVGDPRYVYPDLARDRLSRRERTRNALPCVRLRCKPFNNETRPNEVYLGTNQPGKSSVSRGGATLLYRRATRYIKQILASDEPRPRNPNLPSRTADSTIASARSAVADGPHQSASTLGMWLRKGNAIARAAVVPHKLSGVSRFRLASPLNTSFPSRERERERAEREGR